MAYPGQGYGPGGWNHQQGPPPQQPWGPPPQQPWGAPQQPWGPPHPPQGYGYNQGPPPQQYPQQHQGYPQQGGYGYGNPSPQPQYQPNHAYQQPQSGYGARQEARPPPQGAQQFGHGAPQGYTFQYSNCTGKRKALIIGINYIGTNAALKGCINDASNMSNFLIERFHYKREDMVILTDDQANPVLQPTKQNILRAMNWLVNGAQPNDSLFFHYSGHGGQTKDLDGDEEDGYDEVIYPVDFKQRGHIVDDEIHSILVAPLKPGVRLTSIFDSCHSGSVMDLPYVYSTKGVLKEPNLAKEAGQGLLSAISSYARGDMGGVASSFMSFAKSAIGGGDKAYEKTIRTKTSAADVILWSGSKDDQTSADATIASKATGAMSWAFREAILRFPEKHQNDGNQMSYKVLLNDIREQLEARNYSQKPQLSCSHPLDTNLRFVM